MSGRNLLYFQMSRLVLQRLENGKKKTLPKIMIVPAEGALLFFFFFFFFWRNCFVYFLRFQPHQCDRTCYFGN